MLIPLEVSAQDWYSQERKSIEGMYQRAMDNAKAGRNDEALLILDSLIDKHHQPKAVNTVYHGVAYHEKARIMGIKHEYTKAIELERTALSLMDRTNWSSGWLNMAGFYQSRDHIGDIAEAVKCYEEAIKLVDKGSHNYIMTIMGLARAQIRNGKNTDADKILLTLPKKAEKVYKNRPLNHAVFLTNYSSLLYLQHKYQSAMDYADQAIKLYSEANATNTYNYAILLKDAANYCIKLQNNTRAIQLLEEAKPIMKVAEGERGSGYLDCVNQLAMAYSRNGDTQKSDDYAHQIRSHLSSNNNNTGSHSYADQLRAQGSLHASRGQYNEAAQWAKKALDIFTQRGDSTDMAYTLMELGSYHRFLKEPEIADSLCLISLGLAQRMRLVDVQSESLHQLAAIANGRQDYASARNYLQQSLDIQKKSNRDNTTLYSTMLCDMGLYSYNMGDQRGAADYTLKALEIQEKILGTEHEKNIRLLTNLAVYYHRLGELDSMATYYHRAITLQTNVVRNNFSFMTTKEREIYWNREKSIFDGAPLYVVRPEHTHPQTIRDVYNTLLFTKGLLLNSEVDFRNLLLTSASPAVQKRYDNLIEMRKRLQEYYSSGSGDGQDSIPVLNRMIAEAEYEVMHSCKEFGDFTSSLKINVDSLSKNLREGEMAVELLSIGNSGPGEVFLALYMRRGWETPRVCRLFDGTEVQELGFESINASVLANISQQNRVFSDPQIGQMVWGRLMKDMEDVTDVWIAPSGIFYQWPIEYLTINEDGTRACDKYNVYRLSSTKLLAQQRSTGKLSTKGKAVLFGGMDYNLDTESMLAYHNGEDLILQDEMLLAQNDFEDDTMKGMGLLRSNNGLPSNLPGADAEVTAIADSLDAYGIKYELYDLNGVEERFKSLSGQNISVLHIATHGFAITPRPFRNYSFLDIQKAEGSDNSLCYTGLFFSGCNNALKGKKLPDHVDNGVLTAQEISTMNLQGLDMTVMSACQTGLGEIKDDGVFGLQRGFKKAGAKTLVMSMWEVDDAATSLMMQTFYTGLLKGQTKHQAFANAQNAVRQEFQDPHYWAAFIMLDDI